MQAAGWRSELGRRMAIFAAVAIVSMCVSLCRGRMDHQPSYEEAGIASHLLRGEGFSSPWFAGPQAPPTAYCPPVYPVLIAEAYELAGPNARLASVLLLILNSSCFAAIAVALHCLGRQFASPLAGALAALLLLIHPTFLFFAGDYWDSFVALAIFFWLVLLAARLARRQHPMFRCAVVGVGMGILSLTCASYALSYPLLVLIAVRGLPLRRRLAGIAIAAGMWALVLTPWTFRNYHVFHRVYYVRDELNFELSSSNPPLATGWFDASLASANPWFNSGERDLLLRLGEQGYFDLCGQRFAAEYRAAPRAFWFRVVRRIEYLFISDPSDAAQAYPMLPGWRWRGVVIDRLLLNTLTAMAGLAGVWVSWRLRLRCTWVFGAALLTQVPFLFVAVSDRYVLPLRAALLFFAAILCWGVWHRAAHGQWPVAANHS
jgi:hypothetical protein